MLGCCGANPCRAGLAHGRREDQEQGHGLEGTEAQANRLSGGSCTEQGQESRAAAYVPSARWIQASLGAPAALRGPGGATKIAEVRGRRGFILSRQMGKPRHKETEPLSCYGPVLRKERGAEPR